jgi:hypothetical protein
MICNGAPDPNVVKMVEAIRAWYGWNLAMAYATLTVWGIPTHILASFKDLYDRHADGKTESETV